MTKTLDATYDGAVLRPDEPLDLEPNARVRITIETLGSQQPQRPGFLEVAASLALDGPSDWSERLDDYPYGDGGSGRS